MEIFLSRLTKLKLTAGFTLIEILIVISILGILAVLLLATIDPVEQLKKGQDTQTREVMVEFFNSITRYYGIHGNTPWITDANCNTAAGSNPLEVQLLTLTDCLTALANDGELKSNITSATTALSNIFITGNSSSVTSCFNPQSKSVSNDPNTIYTKSGGTPATLCVSQGGTNNNCYYCLY